MRTYATRQITLLLTSLFAAAAAQAQANEAASTFALATIAQDSCDLPVDHVSVTTPTFVALTYQLDVNGQLEQAKVVRSSGSAAADDAALAAFRTCKFDPLRPGGDHTRLGLMVVPIGINLPSSSASSPAIANVRACAPSADDYPIEARRQNRQGTTQVRFTVNDRGRLLRAEVSSSSGTAQLDYVAAATLTQCQFRAGRDTDGRPMGGSFVVSYIWRLE